MIKVAPLAGAWIEMWYAKYKNTSQLVAPLAGAWIEMTTAFNEPSDFAVAPLAGAWIEIEEPTAKWRNKLGRSPRGSVD